MGRLGLEERTLEKPNTTPRGVQAEANTEQCKQNSSMNTQLSRKTGATGKAGKAERSTQQLQPKQGKGTTDMQKGKNKLQVNKSHQQQPKGKGGHAKNNYARAVQGCVFCFLRFPVLCVCVCVCTRLFS